MSDVRAGTAQSMTDQQQSSGPAPDELGDDDLMRELGQLAGFFSKDEILYETFLHGSESALGTHTARTEALEQEYLRRNPRRDVEPDRLRAGRRDD